jgi:hypothetical protein
MLTETQFIIILAENIYSETLTMPYTNDRPVESWIKSHGHHKNMVGDYSNMGAAVCEDGYSRYFVQNFAKPFPGDPSGPENQYVCSGSLYGAASVESTPSPSATSSLYADTTPVPTATPGPTESKYQNDPLIANKVDVNGSSTADAAAAANAAAAKSNSTNNNNGTNTTTSSPPTSSPKVIPSSASRLSLSNLPLIFVLSLVPILY